MNKLEKKELKYHKYITSAKKIHTDYKYLGYVMIKKRYFLIINCPNENHIEFKMRPYDHISYKFGCKKCKQDIIYENHIMNAKKIHKDYKYLGYEIINNGYYLKIKCPNPDHKEYQHKAHTHINISNGCGKCVQDKTYEKYVLKAKQYHTDYTYIGYRYNKTGHCILKIKCSNKDHSIFEQPTYKHINRHHGCPKCASNSVGEDTIRTYCKKYNIFCVEQIGVKYLGKNYEFDFFIPDLNLFIEYNGIQHYNYTPFFHKSKKYYFYRRLKDEIKKRYCLRNNFKLLTISYKDFSKLEDIIKNLKN